MAINHYKGQQLMLNASVDLHGQNQGNQPKGMAKITTFSQLYCVYINSLIIKILFMY